MSSVIIQKATKVTSTFDWWRGDRGGETFSPVESRSCSLPGQGSAVPHKPNCHQVAGQRMCREMKANSRNRPPQQVLCKMHQQRGNLLHFCNIQICNYKLVGKDSA